MRCSWLSIFSILLVTIFITSSLPAQPTELPLDVFGYFQTQFEIDQSDDGEKDQNSFLLQQLNLFMKKELGRGWTSFVNLEIINNFSLSHNWGALNLEEAWIKYRKCKNLTLKVGLQIPTFNNLNVIKNRTPLLPYIIRPLVYETSFNEFVNIEEFVPQRAYVQAYGFIPIKGIKFDHALYVGNSPNINSDGIYQQTGIDTSASILLGGRIGFRIDELAGLQFDELKGGISGTYDKINFPARVDEFFDEPRSKFEDIPRKRLGADFLLHYDRFFAAGELIHVAYDDDIDELEFEKEFYYGTLGFFITERLFAYASYWYTREKFSNILLNASNRLELEAGEIEMIIPNGGLSYSMHDRITLKGQIARGDIDFDSPLRTERYKFKYYSIAVSTHF